MTTKQQYKKVKRSWMAQLAGIALAIGILSGTGCSKKLEENPYTVFSTEYFRSAEGLQSGVYALYSGLRYNFGPEGAMAISVVGTDEWTYGDQPRTGAGGTGDVLTLGNYTLDFANGAIQTPWNRSYNNINLANALIRFAANINMNEAQKTRLIAESRFFRALYYLILVTQFGAVPLDLGSGELEFNEVPFQGFNRLPTAELLVKNYQTMIDDLTFASENLPDRRPDGEFRLSKAAAFGILSKVYLYRAYSNARQNGDFRSAYNAAMTVINDTARFGTGLMTSFEQVNAPGNDYNKEIIFSVERIPGNIIANEVGNPNAIGGGKGIDATNDFNPDYTAVRAPLASSGTAPVSTRSVLYGRPLRRFCPTRYLYENIFNDKENDSRFDGSFRMVWLATTEGGGFAIGDTAFILAKTNRIADSLNGIAPAGPRLKPYRVIAPREFYIIGGTTAQNIFPALKKYDDPARANANDQGGRPFPVLKMSEVYLLAAEAALGDGRPADALPLINILKRRAAYRPTLTPQEWDARYNNIRVQNSGDITLDFILEERSRELCGEANRWPDLAMRGKLLERVTLANPDAATNIRPFHVLRPIPSGQLDDVADANKQQYQNPGY